MFQTIRRACRHPELIATSLLIFILAMFNSGCNIRMEGCLDLAAENFDLNADKPCDGCCTYPSVTVSLSQKWNDINFRTDTFYTDRYGKPFVINDLRYILSSFTWTGIEGEVHTIDSSEVACGTNMIGFTHDIVIVEPRKFVYVLDTFRLYPTINEIQLKAGWKPELQCVDETDVNLPVVFHNTSPLWDSTANARAAIRLIVQIDTSNEVFDTVFIHTCQDIFVGYEFDFKPGKDTKFDLTVNYAAWFEEADIDDLNSFITSVLENIQGSFTRTP